MKFKIILFLFLIGFSGTLNAQTESLYSEELYLNNGDTLRYRMLLPKNFSEENKYPIVLFLHGAGERGNDNKKQLVHGSKLFLNQMIRGAFPAIIIFPQCPRDNYWSNATVDRSTNPISLVYPLDKPPTKPLDLVIQLIEGYLSKPYVDKNKVYVGGLSMGGMGTFEILYQRPNIFAAAFAICGGGNPESAKEYATKTELWVFHGAKDDVVNPQLSVDMVSAILKYGGKPNFTLYADDNHNSWDSAFAEPQLLPWLFSKSKN
ncbi:prolyl oligopeptidase family serine peptidase [Yeosuana sp. MJ-SS3]|uniref:Prolyl oligopeptidase family serine peptidase n=1 Tax=Gilvirhabdus luticola TaxID=3079858 RepID=A0ABU3U6C1_9FLAO|nr:prolyl oligopeptidase family serine peptidase [Yeosuana sp. MJ-SS3]MDU8885881.1 prolyl oligopeptidase family serine peptidase [Yeosuana sp. MJ-SS3]